MTLPLWQCHKRVRAAQIAGITDLGTSKRLHLSNADTITVDSTWMLRHEAQVGGYYVVYEDGYASYSPAQAFQAGYSPVPETQGA